MEKRSDSSTENKVSDIPDPMNKDSDKKDSQMIQPSGHLQTKKDRAQQAPDGVRGVPKKNHKFWNFMYKKKPLEDKQMSDREEERMEAMNDVSWADEPAEDMSVSCLCTGLRRSQIRLKVSQECSAPVEAVGSDKGCHDDDAAEAGTATMDRVCDITPAGGSVGSSVDQLNSARQAMSVTSRPSPRDGTGSVGHAPAGAAAAAAIDEDDDIDKLISDLENVRVVDGDSRPPESSRSSASTYPHLSYGSGGLTSDLSVAGDGIAHHRLWPVPPRTFHSPMTCPSVIVDGADCKANLGFIPRTIHTQVDYIHCLVPDLRKITNCSYYWGVMDRYEAERLLENRPEGTFLLRDSAQEEFLFSVSFRRYSRSLHARVEQWNHKFSFDSHDPSVYASMSVCGLIEHYKDPACCMFFEPMLTLPLARTFPFSLQHLCRAAICSMTTYDGVSYLPLPKSLHQFLQYYHYKQKVRVRRFETLHTGR